MGMTNDVDLVIVGAGAAGLGAAHRAQDLGLSFRCLEAMDRIGGRAYTDSSTFGTPWDRGCHWLHSGSVNVFAGLADTYGIRYESASAQRRSFDCARWLSADEQSDLERTVYDEMRGAIAAAGHAGRDVSAATIVDMSNHLIPALRTGLAGEWGVDIAEVSTADDAAYRDTNENWPVRDGYGTLRRPPCPGDPG